MKVVYASTPEQQEKIHSLTEYFFTNIFPDYFSDQEIYKFKEWGFLEVDEAQLSDTLKESYQIISSLEILIDLIESDFLQEKHYQNMFETNVNILNQLGISFPFSYQQFLRKRKERLVEGSVFKKAANDWLI